MTSKIISFTVILLICLTTAHAEDNICQDESSCRQKFNTLNTGGSFYIDVKDGAFGCFTKNNNGFWGSGGNANDISTANLPGEQTRLYCNDVTDTTTTPNPSISPTYMPTTWEDDTTVTTTNEAMSFTKNEEETNTASIQRGVTTVLSYMVGSCLVLAGLL